MSIQSIGLKNFTVFKDFQLDVSTRINVFIGENGTGKTHLLKAIYAACELSKTENTGDDLLKCFKENQQEGNLLRDKAMGQLIIEIKSAQVNRVIRRGTGLITPSTEDLKRFAPSVKSMLSSNYFVELPYGKKFSAVYIPVKDMLTHSAGFLAMANKYRD